MISCFLEIIFAPGLERDGMITSAGWADINGDGWPDLILAGEFMPVRVWISQEGQFLRRNQSILPELGGWWQTINVFDYDQDGDLDILAGNIGMNGPMKAYKDNPVCIRAADYDQNGSIDPVYTACLETMAYPVSPRGTLFGQIPSWTSLIPNFTTYAGWSENELPTLPADGIIICANEFRSVLFRNDDNGQFSIKALPVEAQISPLTSFAWLDFFNVGHK